MVRAGCLRFYCRGSRAILAKIALLFAAAGCLAGCVESEASPPAQAAAPVAAPRRDASLRSEEVKPHAASVALASLSGVPEPVADQMKKAFAQEAAQRDIHLADANKADYLARAYLSAAPTEVGTSITVVFDVFDAGKKRALRFEDNLLVKGPSGPSPASDPWSAVGAAAIVDVAAKSADSLAAFLINAPEAVDKGKPRQMAARPAASARSAAAGAGKDAAPALASSRDRLGDLNLAELR